ncbi:MAG: PAS domain-containing protein [Vulcanimicrobiota bacterium]
MAKEGQGGAGNLGRPLVQGVSSHAIVTLDSAGLVVSCSLGAERLTGYKAEDIVGQPFSRFYIPEDVALGKPEDGLARAVADGCFEDEGMRLRKDGSRFLATFSITPIYDHSPDPVGFVTITRESTKAG